MSAVPGPNSSPLSDAQRHLGKRADRPDGVHVPDQELPRLAARRVPRPRVQVVADAAPSRTGRTR